MNRNPLVMIPGPTPVVRSIQDQMGRETIAFNDMRFVGDFKNLIDDLEALWRCDGVAFVVAGSGTMAMEMAIANVAGQDDRVLVCSNGHFGDRYVDICGRKGFEMETLTAKWGQSVTIQEIDEKLSAKKFDILVATHIETSTGAILDVKALADMMRAKHPEVLIIIDGVASMGGAEFYMDWGIDIMFTCSQKCFGAAPGLGLLWASKRAIAKRESLGTIREVYVDFEKWIPVMKEPLKYWGTPAVNMLWGMMESVRIIKEEGLEPRFKRHLLYADAIRKALAAIGFASAAEEAFVSPTLSVFMYPKDANLDDAKFRGVLYEEGVHVAGCLGEFAGKGFRVGHMGNIDPHILVSTVAGIERACVRCGYKIQPGKALGALQEVLLKG